jgi:thiamine pyrophosphate-dependent acetolactate synthase large subunit-like protein
VTVAAGTQAVVDAVVAALRRDGVELLSAYPTTPLIDAATRAGIRAVLCRQERVGVGIADGYSRVAPDGRYGVFACQYGPGAENAFGGIASAHADGIPLLVLPLGNAMVRRQVPPMFQSVAAFGRISKSYEVVTRPGDVHDVMRRALSAMRNGPPGPVVVEIPFDLALRAAPPAPDDELGDRAARPAADAADVERALDTLLDAERPVILAGAGVLRAGASAELVELAELLACPVLTTLSGKSAMPELHPLSLGTATRVAPEPVVSFLRDADVVFAIGSSLTDHFLSPRLPAGARVIHATLDPRDFHKSQRSEYVLFGDAKLVLAQFLEAAKERAPVARTSEEVAAAIERSRAPWLAEWNPILTSNDIPMTPYRVLHEFMQRVDPDTAIVTHDSGSPRDQIVPFYRAGGPNTYLGWGKSHALGGGLGLALGAKLAAPDKLVVHFQGDAAFGMTGLDLDTAARCSIPILSVVLNNSTMAIETPSLVDSHEAFNARDIGGDYTALAAGLGVAARRVERPAELRDVFDWAIRTTIDGKPALVEVITSAETRFSHRGAISFSHEEGAAA